MEVIQNLLDSTNIPIISALLLGLMTAISPCPLATNITAIGYISKDIENRNIIFRNGLLYTLGRIIGYFGLALIIIPILREGASTFAIQKGISKWGELVIGPALILIGLFMLFSKKLNLPKLGLGSLTQKVKGKNWWSALLLGVLFALAFCPTSGVFFFGMLMPLSAAEPTGYLLPILFAIATGLPVILVAWILAYSVSRIGNFYKNIQVFQKWMNWIIGGLFIFIGIYYTLTYYI